MTKPIVVEEARRFTVYPPKGRFGWLFAVTKDGVHPMSSHRQGSRVFTERRQVDGYKEALEVAWDVYVKHFGRAR